MNPIWTQISYSSPPHEAHLKNQRVALVCQKGEKCGKLQKVFFQKSQKLFAENLHERPPIQNIQ